MRTPLFAPVSAAVENAKIDLGFLRLAPEAWDQTPDISIDYAVMEKADNLAVVPFGGNWSDLGGWGAVWRESAPDADGVVATGGAVAIEGLFDVRLDFMDHVNTAREREATLPYPALALAARVLGGGALKNRLMDRLRQKEGISYGAAGGRGNEAIDKRITNNINNK